MKTSIFKLFLSAFAIALSLSSCLSDGSNSYEVNKDFAYITTLEGGKYAATRNGYITSPAINQLELGECYFIGYKIDASAGANGIYTATDINAPKLLPQYQSREVPSVPAISNEFYPTIFSPLPYWDAGEYFKNRWPFAFQAKLKAKEETYAYFYYDRNNQKEIVSGEEKPLGNNQLIIDVRFSKKPGVDGVTEKITEEISADLTPIRESFKTSGKLVYEQGKTDVIVAIKFRYLKDVDKADPEQALIGTWDINSGSQGYGFIYSQK